MTATRDPTKLRRRRGLAALRRLLRGLRWNSQGGYPCYRGRGKWDFVSTALPQTVPEDLNALFALAGITPDAIIPRGACKHCVHARNGMDRGWGGMCGGCGKPRMTHFRKRRS